MPNERSLAFDKYIATLLLMTKEEIDAQIINEIRSLDLIPDYLAQIIELKQSSPLTNFLENKPEPRETSPLAAVKITGLQNAVEKYVDMKNYVLTLPGHTAATFILENAPEIGLKICVGFNYRRNIVTLEKNINLLKSFEWEKIYVGKTMVQIVTARLGDENFLPTIKQVINQISDDIADIAMPLSIIIKALKFGMDELCPCCNNCNGSGITNNADCKRCKGNGLRYPG